MSHYKWPLFALSVIKINKIKSVQEQHTKGCTIIYFLTGTNKQCTI